MKIIVTNRTFNPISICNYLFPADTEKRLIKRFLRAIRSAHVAPVCTSTLCRVLIMLLSKRFTALIWVKKGLIVLRDRVPRQYFTWPRGNIQPICFYDEGKGENRESRSIECSLALYCFIFYW